VLDGVDSRQVIGKYKANTMMRKALLLALDGMMQIEWISKISV